MNLGSIAKSCPLAHAPEEKVAGEWTAMESDVESKIVMEPSDGGAAARNEFPGGFLQGEVLDVRINGLYFQGKVHCCGDFEQTAEGEVGGAISN